VKRHGGAKRRRPPQRSEDEKSITASAVITPHPVKPREPSFKPRRSLCAPSEWSRQGEAAAGAYLRVSGPSGPLTGVYAILPAIPLTATQNLVTTSITKSDVIPGLRPGAAALFRGGSRRRWCRCARSAALIVLYVVTMRARQRPLQRGGTNLCCFRTGADVSPLQGRAFS